MVRAAMRADFRHRSVSRPTPGDQGWRIPQQPKNLFGPQGNAVGFWQDLLANIALKEEWNIQYVPGSWQECLDRLSAGEIDIIPDVIFTESRSHLYTFSETTVIMSWTRLYVHQDNISIRCGTWMGGLWLPCKEAPSLKAPQA